MNTKIRVTKSLVTGIAALALLAGCASAAPKAGDPDFRGDGTDGVKSDDKNTSVSKTGGITDGMNIVEFDFIGGMAAPKGEAIHVEIPEIILNDSEGARTTITEAYTITSVETDKLGLCAVGIDIEYRDGADMSLRDIAYGEMDYMPDPQPDLGALQSAVKFTYVDDFKNISFQKLGGKPTEPGITMAPDYSSVVVADACPGSGEVLGMALNFRGAYLEGSAGSPYTYYAELDVTVDSEGTVWTSPVINYAGDNTSIHRYRIDSAGNWMPK